MADGFSLFLFGYVQNGGCAQNPTPLPSSAKLCKTQCQQTVAANAAIFADSNACPAILPGSPSAAAAAAATATTTRFQNNRAVFLRTLSSSCVNADDTQKTCTRGLTSEVSRCGFSQFDEARTYCGTAEGRADACCLLVIGRASAQEIGSLVLPSSVVDPVDPLPYIASGVAVAGMLLFSVMFVVCVKSRRWRTVSTTAIQPPESDIAPGPALRRVGTIAKGRPEDGDGDDDNGVERRRIRRTRVSLAQQFRRSVLGVKPRKTDPAPQLPTMTTMTTQQLPAQQNAKMVQLNSEKQRAKQYAAVGGGLQPSQMRTFGPSSPPLSLSRRDPNGTVGRKPTFGSPAQAPVVVVRSPMADNITSPTPMLMAAREPSPPPPPPPSAASYPIPPPRVFAGYSAAATPGPASAAEGFYLPPVVVVVPAAGRMVVAEAYDRQMPDEITLIVGDVIVILQQFDDGWAVGRNESTGAVGALPLSCLDPLFPNSPSAATLNKGNNNPINAAAAALLSPPSFSPSSRPRPRSDRKSSLYFYKPGY
ncbi:hypothetical protein HDU86_002036 [Geranomyces michiganensis]|nr:hypothetical protein HDU86_002036 [Geranomyces michiganensis]